MKTVLAFAVLLFAIPAAQAGGLLDVSVYDRTEGRRLTVHWHEGRAHVAGKPGNEYRISLRSRSGEDLLAVVSVDGVNVITGETAHPAQSGYVLSPRGGLDIAGWRKSLERTAAFYFTALPDSYAARTGRPDNVGVIGVALFRRKAAEAPPAPIGQAAPRARAEASGARGDGAAGPAAEPSAESPATAKSRAESDLRDAQRLGTGHGRQEVSHARHVSFERATREPAQTIVIHYDSRENLVARGVIREAAPIALCARRPAQCHPRAFPGFVPDPQSAVMPLPSCC